MSTLSDHYPWTKSPQIIGAPMRLIALPSLAVSVSAAGGIGFIGAGSDIDSLDSWLSEATDLISQHETLKSYHESSGILPVGFGFFNWAPEADLEKAMTMVRKWKPAAVWQFGAHRNADYAIWADKIRQAGEGKTKVWVQVGNVADAIEVATTATPDVLVIQGTDAGGHGLVHGAGITTLVPEVQTALAAKQLQNITIVAAGGIVEGRGAAAALMLGAEGVVLGTRLLASHEAKITAGYKNEIVRASDGATSTARTKVYDRLRGTTLWPERYNARGVLNRSYHDDQAGVSFEENKRLHDEAMGVGDGGWGVDGRITTYAGTGVGLVREVKGAGDIVVEVREDAKVRMRSVASRYT